MKRLLMLIVVLSAAVSCTRSGRPVVGQALEETGREYVDPYYFRSTPKTWKVIWFIGPGHCPFIRPTSAALGIEKIEMTDPDTKEEFMMRSPVYYVWLYPLERFVFGTHSYVVGQPSGGGRGGRSRTAGEVPEGGATLILTNPAPQGAAPASPAKP